MATLIRSARIAPVRRLLDDGISPEKKSGVGLETRVDRQRDTSESTMRLESELRATSQARSELEDALRHSQERTAQTEAELQRLLGGIDELRQDAVATGQESGYQAGCKEGRIELERQVERLGDLIGRIAKLHEETLAAADDEIAEVVFASVVKILGEGMVGADAVIAAVRQSIKQLVSRDGLTIHLSPGDKRLIDETAAGKQEELFGPGVKIVADERVELGGCLLQTRTGGLDARLEVQLRRLRDCLIDTVDRRAAERNS